MGPRPTRRLVVGDTEASEEITSQRSRRKEKGKTLKRREGWRHVGAGW